MGWHQPSFWFRCLLLLTAWNGPIPYVHAHGTLANSSATLAVWLSDHLQTHHPDVSLFANQLFQWHVHVELPSQPGKEGDEETSRLPQAMPLLASSDSQTGFGVKTEAPDNTWVLVADELSHGEVAGHQSSVAQANHFFGAFAPTLSMPLRFGIMRC